MSRSTQDKVLAAIETSATDYGFELIVNKTYGNTGSLRIEDPDTFESYLHIGFSFQESYYTLDPIRPTLPGLTEPRDGKAQSVGVWATPVHDTPTTSDQIIKAIRNHLAGIKQAKLDKEFA